MITPNERSFEKAATKLREQTKKQRGEAVNIFKGFRKIEEHRMRMWHRSGGGGREIARVRADMVDVLCRELFSTVVSEVAPKGLPEPLAMAAFGGYGRRELTPMSDIDIIFLHTKTAVPQLVEEVIRTFLMSLWDIGFKVGHATRSVSGAIKQANADLITKTAMLESRFLVGDREVFNDFRERFEDECVRGREDAYIAWRLANQDELHAKYGGTVFVQEPNVKGGVGGLRDYQNLLWLAYFKTRASTGSKLVEKRILRERERSAIERGYDFLLRVRAEMQYLGGRASDILTLQMQGRVATSLGYPQRHILRRVEAFMRDYYSHSRAIQLFTSAGIERLNVRPETPKPGLLGILKKPRTEKFDGFIARGGRLFVESKEVFGADEFRLIRAFSHAQVRGLELSAELRDLIRRRLPLVNRTFQYARASRETFLAILSRKGEVGRILREMHDLGFLGRYVPEFGELTCLVQHEFYHRYTADEHTLVCIEKLDGILFTKEQRLAGYRELFQKLEDPAMLYLAILLHDTGKSANTRNHEDASALLAQKVARRLQLGSERRKMLITLVNSHYELSLTAQKRNLDDPSTIKTFAGIVRSRPELDALMLLTLADGMGTSDENWSDWKEGLVWTLYRHTANYLDRGPDALEIARRNSSELKEAVVRQLPKDFAQEIAVHLEHMPERYYQMFDAETISEHLRLFRVFLDKHLRSEKGALTPAFRWISRPEQSHSELWICGWDRERFLERIAGALLSCCINILSADIFTRADNLALDIFRVGTTGLQPITSEKDMARVESRLGASLLTEDYDFKPLLKAESKLHTYKISQDADLPSKISIDNGQHPEFTLVDIQTPDRLGLLYDLLRAFGEASVNIELSRITTEMDVALDSFYITARDGGKLIKDSSIRQLQKLLQRACAPRAHH
ncbi:MAG: [protein-PII] uridylyltransferase [Terrimicrobiaceae bacterium]